MDNKVAKSLRDAILASGLRDGMRISFHHHLRNGDFVLNAVLKEIAALGIKNLVLNASSLFDVHLPLLEHIRNGVVTEIWTDYMSGGIGEAVSAGILEKPVKFMTHGGRPTAIMNGKTPIDVAFIASPTADVFGNCTGKQGKSACGSLGYAFADAKFAKKTVVVTDNLIEKLDEVSIPGEWVDTIVKIDEIGDPAAIVSGTTAITRDPVGLLMARDAAEVIRASGLLRDGFNFQTGAGGASLAAAQFLKNIMREEKVIGGYGLGGITKTLVEMLEEGLFRELRDVQCFDLKAVSSIKKNPLHQEISAYAYASPDNPDAAVNGLDVVILGATEIDTDFNVNVHTDSVGRIMGGSGGHSDTAAGAKLSMIVAPLFRARQPIITDRVTAISTPGRDIDVLVTQYGIAVNPKNAKLALRLSDAGLPVVPIEALKEKAEKITGVPAPLTHGDKIVAEILDRTGALQDVIYEKK